MTKYAVDILSNDELATQMGQQGRKRVLEHFDKDAIIDQYEVLYKSLFTDS